MKNRKTNSVARGTKNFLQALLETFGIVGPKLKPAIQEKSQYIKHVPPSVVTHHVQSGSRNIHKPQKRIG